MTIIDALYYVMMMRVQDFSADVGCLGTAPPNSKLQSFRRRLRICFCQDHDIKAGQELPTMGIIRFNCEAYLFELP